MAKLTYASLFLACSLATEANAYTCIEFTEMGTPVNDIGETISTSASIPQAKIFRTIIADHAAKISFVGSSSRSTALDFVMKNDKMTTILAASLGMTRMACLEKPSANLDTIAVEQFDVMLDKIAAKLSVIPKEAAQRVNKNSDTSELMESAVVEANKNYPQMLDNVTRVDRASYEDGTFKYYYTLLNSPKYRYSQQMLLDNIYPSLLTDACVKMREVLFKYKTPIAYVYRRENGKLIGELRIKASDCE